MIFPACPAARRSASGYGTIPATSGTRPEPHCFAAASATLSHRDSRFRASAGSRRGIVRDERNGITCETPSSVAFSRMKSILSAFGSPTNRETATSGGGSGGNASRISARRERDVASRMRIRYRFPPSSKAKKESPAERRRERSMCPASVPERTAVSPEMFFRSTKKVGIAFPRSCSCPPSKEERRPLPVDGFGEKGGAVFHELLDDPAALLRKDAGENEVPARGRPPQEVGGHVDQDLRDQIAKDQVEGAGDRGQGGRLRAEHVRHPVFQGVLRGDGHRHGVGVDREDTLRAEARRGDPEDPRSRPHVEGVPGGRREIEHILDHPQAHSRGLVGAGSEGQAA